MKESIEKYIDIINMPHHVSKNHPHMSKYERAAQFAPFAALSGYEDIIKEEGRLTDNRVEINEEAKFILDRKMQILMNAIDKRPFISITYFVPDEKKAGGEYVTIDENIKKIDVLKQIMVTEKDTIIPVNEIVDMQGEIFKNLELDC
ncbi:MAG: hypothetical protein IKE91_05705 [Clostridia bacterium]|nr:hypothetical protein [Clostridia bacterium]